LASIAITLALDKATCGQLLPRGGAWLITKQHILDEIKRTAQANGGAPLGVRKFEGVTGIRGHEWGRYWARWGDAQNEAGFDRNTLQAGYGNDALLEAVARLMQGLGRFPTSRERNLRHAQEPSFPTDKTFRRFGGEAALASAVLHFCRARPEYQDVVEFCEARTNQLAKPSAQVAVSQNLEFGFVYLLRSGRYFKIGRSNAVGRRERELAVQMPERAEVVHSIKTDDPAGIEDYWHRRFAHARKGGEWFSLSAADVQAFKRRKFM
jgi:hypothetical protein